MAEQTVDSRKLGNEYRVDPERPTDGKDVSLGSGNRESKLVYTIITTYYFTCQIVEKFQL